MNTQALDCCVWPQQRLNHPCGIARAHAASPTLNAQGWGIAFNVPQQPLGADERSRRYRPDLIKPQMGSACRWGAIGMDLHRTG